MMVTAEDIEQFNINTTLLPLILEEKWYEISKNYKLSEDFIGKYKHKLCWEVVCAYQTLSEEFIDEHRDYLTPSCWQTISWKQKLSMPFIFVNANLLNWNLIIQKQKLSLVFLGCMYDLVNWELAVRYQKHIFKYKKLTDAEKEKYAEADIFLNTPF